jgi:hypothetical protein
MKLAIGAGNGGGAPRRAGTAAGPFASGLAAIIALARATAADCFAAASALLFDTLRGAGSRSAVVAPRGLACAAFSALRFSPFPPALRARTAPGRFARARGPTPGFLLLEVLMTRAPQTLLSGEPGCQLSTRPEDG